jgi:hypothetical protein
LKESKLQTDIMNMLLNHELVSWAYVTSAGGFRVKGGYITVGFKGLSDIIGQLKDGRLFAIEVKLPGKTPTPEQLGFIETVNSANGVAGWCDSVEGASLILIGQ